MGPSGARPRHVARLSQCGGGLHHPQCGFACGRQRRKAIAIDIHARRAPGYFTRRDLDKLGALLARRGARLLLSVGPVCREWSACLLVVDEDIFLLVEAVGAAILVQNDERVTEKIRSRGSLPGVESEALWVNG